MDQMTLATIVPRLPSFDQDDEMVIHMRQPWSLSSDCEVVSHDAKERAEQDGFEYFLEVAVALEVLEGYADRDLSLDEQSARLLFYAENDAFLD
ncbi:MAG: hypothetical protein KF823_03760 [Xanthomonadales bacterium]|nr:hypothetical protein [Xanthomonadales bacterium]